MREQVKLGFVSKNQAIQNSEKTIASFKKLTDWAGH
ncbi:MAG: hypothetical protein JWQ28_2512 [Pedobacter sp.]|jgi:hypothetical protein|nr:hypothetical protein [Pedobacter sp.]